MGHALGTRGPGGAAASAEGAGRGASLTHARRLTEQGAARPSERPSALGQERFPPGHGDLQRAAVTDTVSETLLFENKCGQSNIPEYYT